MNERVECSKDVGQLKGLGFKGCRVADGVDCHGGARGCKKSGDPRRGDGLCGEARRQKDRHDASERVGHKYVVRAAMDVVRKT